MVPLVFQGKWIDQDREPETHVYTFEDDNEYDDVFFINQIESKDNNNVQNDVFLNNENECEDEEMNDMLERAFHFCFSNSHKEHLLRASFLSLCRYNFLILFQVSITGLFSCFYSRIYFSFCFFFSLLFQVIFSCFCFRIYFSFCSRFFSFLFQFSSLFLFQNFIQRLSSYGFGKSQRSWTIGRFPTNEAAVRVSF